MNNKQFFLSASNRYLHRKDKARFVSYLRGNVCVCGKEKSPWYWECVECADQSPSDLHHHANQACQKHLHAIAAMLSRPATDGGRVMKRKLLSRILRHVLCWMIVAVINMGMCIALMDAMQATSYFGVSRTDTELLIRGCFAGVTTLPLLMFLWYTR